MPDARPVFVDPTGRRRRKVRAAASVGVGTILCGAGVLVVALLGSSGGPTTSLPDHEPIPPTSAGPAPARPEIGQPTGITPGTGPGEHPGAAPVGGPGNPAGPADPAAQVTTTTTAATKGKPDHTPPGRPTDLPTPPGHTR